MTIEDFWLEAVLIIALILANGFFAASEIAVIAMRKSRIDAMLDRAVKSAAVIARLKNDPDRFLATVQVRDRHHYGTASARSGSSRADTRVQLLRRWIVRGMPLRAAS